MIRVLNSRGRKSAESGLRRAGFLLCLILLSGLTGCLIEDNVRPDYPNDGDTFILVSPRALDFDAQETELTIQISNAGYDTLDWHVTWDRNWIDAIPSSGRVIEETDQVAVRVHRGDLSDGIYTGSLTVRDREGQGVTVALRMSVQSPRLSIEPHLLDFGATATEAEFTIVNIGGGSLHWRLETLDDWITFLPTAGVTARESDPVTVRIDRAGLERGIYNGEINILTDDDDVIFTVQMSVGQLLWGFYPSDNIILDRVWDCYDDNLFSDLDFWGVETLYDEDENPYPAIWCNGRGIHPEGSYSDNMDAWMVQRSMYAADIRGRNDVEIRFEMAYETESPVDYVRLCIWGSDREWYYIPEVTEWSGEDYVWRRYSVRLDDFSRPPEDYLLLAFKFNSDVSLNYRGAFLRDIEVWGD